MSTPTVPIAVSLSVVYHPTEDRLVLVATTRDGTAQALMVTRRLAIRLVNGLAQVLERTSPAAAEAPPRARGDIVMFEHQGALAVGAQAQARTPEPDRPATPAPAPAPAPAAASDTATRMQALLLEALDIGVQPRRFVLTLKSAGTPMARTEVTRDELHRLLALLRRKCDEDAHWNLPIETAWLDLDTGSTTLN